MAIDAGASILGDLVISGLSWAGYVMGLTARRLRALILRDSILCRAMIESAAVVDRERSDRVRREPGWSPKVDFSDGLVETITWCPENAVWLDDIRPHRHGGERLGPGVTR